MITPEEALKALGNIDSVGGIDEIEIVEEFILQQRNFIGAIEELSQLLSKDSDVAAFRLVGGWVEEILDELRGV